MRRDAGCADVLFHHFLDGSFQLPVVAIQVVFRRIVNDNIRVQLLVFPELTVHALASHLWYAKDHIAVDEGLPPYCCHGPSHWRTNQLADSQGFVNPREPMPVAVVIFTDQHARRFHPFVKRVAPIYFPCGMNFWYSLPLSRVQRSSCSHPPPLCRSSTITASFCLFSSLSSSL